MTISSTTARVVYTGNGATVNFAFSYYVIEATDLEVYLDGVLKTITTHYTLSGSAPYTGGTTVQFVTAPASGVQVLIRRKPPITQTVDPTDNGPLPVDTQLEQPLDKLTMVLQYMSEVFARCIKLPLTSTQTEIDYPEGASAAARASKHVRWNAAGDGLELVTVGTDAVTGVITTKGDLIQGGTSGVPERLAAGALGAVLYIASTVKAAWLAGNITTTKKFLSQTGDGAASAAPTWEALGASDGVFTTGDVKLTIKTVADTGWVLMNDGTIGNGSSGGTTRANADTESLFTLLWNNTADAQCAVSTGRGASAAADFAANKTIALPKALGRALACYGAGSGLTSRALALITGTETHTLTTGEIPAHTHVINCNDSNAAGSSQPKTSDGAGTTRGMSTQTDGGSGGAHNNMQPTVFLNIMVKL